MRRTFVGDSQSTTVLKLTALSSRPVTSTRSSCSRPIRCWVCAASRSIGAPPSQRTRSRSWVARSLTTPTSRTRPGNGPTRSVAMRNTSPSWPSWTRRRSSSSAGLQRSTKPTAARTPAASQSAMISRPSSTVVGERLLDQQVDAGGGERRAPRRRARPSAPRRPRSPASRPPAARRSTGTPGAGSLHGAVAIPAGVDGAGEPHAGRALEQPRVVPAHHAEAQDGPAQDRSVGGHAHRSH